MKTEKEKILAIIAEIQEEREAAHIIPPHVLTAEIINRGCHQPYQAINELCAEGKVKWCRTLNDMAFTIRKKINQEQYGTNPINTTTAKAVYDQGIR